MFDFNDPNTFWLNVTNLILGLVTLICVAVVGRGVYQDIRARFKKRAHVAADDHAFVIPELGITMADGGKRVEGNMKSRGNGSNGTGDEENIFRSEN